MGVPYSQQISEYLNRHLYVKDGGTWRTAEEIHIKHAGSWRKTKEVWVKESGTWRLVQEGEHFLFNYHQTSNSTSEFNLSSWLSGQGYSSGPIKGVVNIQAKRKRVNLGNFSGRVYLWVQSGHKISGSGGNGGNRGGQNGAVGMDAVYSGGTDFLLNNQGVIAGGGGGGGGGQNAQCTYQNTYTYGCMKGNQCQGTDQQFANANGGGGGGGAGYPGGQGKDGGQNGQETGGGGGGGNDGCGSNSGGSGGNLGQSGQNVTGGSGGSNGKAIVGYNHKISDIGSGNGDLRGGTSNT
tara:strand:+ start:7 stop:888 length:882 start_codon:yes stop_codon:yes gene_type:complete